MVTSLTVGESILCFVLAALFWFTKIGKKKSINIGKQHHPRVVAVLVMAGSAGLTATGAGRWINSAATAIAGGIVSVTGKWIPGLGADVLVACIAIALVYILVVHAVKEKQIDKHTLNAAFFLPFLATSIPGMGGRLIVTVIAWVAYVPAWILNWAFGRM